MVTLVGGTTAAFYGWLPLYLPELFPTRVRATGQGLVLQFGARAGGSGRDPDGPLDAVLRRQLRSRRGDHHPGLHRGLRAYLARPGNQGQAAA